MLALAGARNVRPALLMLGGLVVLNAGWQKTFLLNLHRFIDTQGRGVHGPDERGLERLFTHNVKLYNCVAGLRAYAVTSNRSRIAPDQRSKGMCAMERWDG
jgi:hypothetical protein